MEIIFYFEITGEVCLPLRVFTYFCNLKKQGPFEADLAGPEALLKYKEFYEIIQKNFLIEHLQTTASVILN